MEKIKWFTKELDPNVLYNDLEQLFTQCGWPFVIAENKVIPNGLFWSSLVGIVMQRSIEYSATPVQDQCSTDITKATSYGGYNYETNMLILGLMTLSWLKVNIKKKQKMVIVEIPFIRRLKTNHLDVLLAVNSTKHCMMIIKPYLKIS